MSEQLVTATDCASIYVSASGTDILHLWIIATSFVRYLFQKYIASASRVRMAMGKLIALAMLVSGHMLPR